MFELLTPDILIKLCATTLVVVVATVIAERASPFIAAMIAALPISAGPGYLFIAMEHGAEAVAKSALTGVGVNAMTAVFLGFVVFLTPRSGLIIAIIIALLIWTLGALIVLQSHLSLVDAIMLNLIIFPIVLKLTKGGQSPKLPTRVKLQLSDITLRAVSVACVVLTVLLVGRSFGPAAAGLVALIPVVWMNIAIILYARLGAIACINVLSSGVLAMAGYCLALMVLHLVTMKIGMLIGLGLALTISVSWNMGLIILRTRLTRT